VADIAVVSCLNRHTSLGIKVSSCGLTAYAYLFRE